MILGGRFRRSAALPVAILAAACALAPVASARSGGGELSPRLAELARPPLRTASPAAQARALSLSPDGPGSLLRQGDRLLVEVRFDHGAAAAADELRAAGAEVIHVSARYQTVTVAAKPAGLPRIEALRPVAGITENLAPLVLGADAPPSTTAAAAPCLGAATSEGDVQLRAAEARQAFGVDGSGVTVGVLSDSFDRDGGAATNAAADVASGDLPGAGNPCGRNDPVAVLDDSEANGADEGRAMAQIIHDLAPGAKLAFATAFTGEAEFASNIERLAKPVAQGGAGAKAIVDDVIYFSEPFFQDGPIAVAADNATAAGASYFSAAGNENLIDPEGRDVASWEAPAFRDAAGCSAGLEAAAGSEHCMDFNPGSGTDTTFGITVATGATLTVDLQWAEPWNGVTTDIDGFLLDASGKPLKAGASLLGSFDDNVGGSQKPVEVFQWQNKTGSSQEVQLAIDRCFDACNPGASDQTAPRLKVVLLQNGGGVTATEYPTSSDGDTVGPTIFGHSAAAGAIGVGAVRYNNNAAPERFSSRGPVAHYFGPVKGTSPASPLATPEVRAKPDLVATDGGANTFFGSSSAGSWRFFGTSAAAPHVAAVAALMLDADEAASPAEIRASLAATAQPVGVFGSYAVGAGLVDALAAIGDLAGATPPVEEPEESEEVPDEKAPEEGEPEGSGEEGGVEETEEGETPPSLVQGPSDAVARGPLPAEQPLDRLAPHTFFLAHPRALIDAGNAKARAIFRFGSNETAATFFCRADAEPYRRCRARRAWRFAAGPHVVRVKARDAAGNFDPTPAVYRFRVSTGR
jgi:hypothetical protein